MTDDFEVHQRGKLAQAEQTIAELHDKYDRLAYQWNESVHARQYLQVSLNLLCGGLEANITLYEAMAKEAHSKGDHEWAVACRRAADANRKLLYNAPRRSP